MNLFVLLFSEFSAAKVKRTYYKRFKQIFHLCYNFIILSYFSLYNS